MGRIRLLITQTRQAETQLLIKRSGRASRAEPGMLVVTIVLAILSIAARVGLFFLGERSLGRT